MIANGIDSLRVKIWATSPGKEPWPTKVLTSAIRNKEYG